MEIKQAREMALELTDGHEDTITSLGEYDMGVCSALLERIIELEKQLLFLVNSDSINDSSIEKEVLMLLAPDV